MNNKNFSPEMSNDPEEITDIRPEQEVEVLGSEILENNKDAFKKLYEALKRYRGKDLKLFQLEGKSDRIREIVSDIKDTLEEGGAKATADKLLKAVIDKANDSESEFDFLESIFSPNKLVTGSDLHNFFKHYLSGLEQQAKISQEAA